MIYPELKYKIAEISPEDYFPGKRWDSRVLPLGTSEKYPNPSLTERQSIKILYIEADGRTNKTNNSENNFLLLHSLTLGPGLIHEPLILAAAMRGYRVIAPYGPGVFDPTYSRPIEDFTFKNPLHLNFENNYIATVALMNKLGIEKADIAGTSRGAALSMEIANRNYDRVNSLYLDDLGYFLPGEHLRKIYEYVSQTEFGTKEEAENAFKRRVEGFKLSDDSLEYATERSIYYDEKSGKFRTNTHDGRIADGFLAPFGDLEKIPNIIIGSWGSIIERNRRGITDIPITIIRGAESKLFPQKTAYTMVQSDFDNGGIVKNRKDSKDSDSEILVGKNATLITYKGYGHAPPLNTVSQIADLISFLENIRYKEREVRNINKEVTFRPKIIDDLILEAEGGSYIATIRQSRIARLLEERANRNNKSYPNTMFLS